MQNPYWLTMSNGEKFCIEATSQLDAKRLAEQERPGQTVVIVQTLPYSAHPLLIGSMPTFCMSPNQCAGHTACTRSYSCTE